MKISAKKKSQISSESTQALIEALKRNPMRYAKPDQQEWWESPPDTWSKEETQMFDTMSELTDDLTRRIINVIESKR